MRRLALWIAVVAAAWCSGCASAPWAEGPAVVDVLLPDGRRTLAVGELLERAALAPGQDLRVVELGRDDRTSHHLVGIRHGEQPHRHDRHDLLVLLLRGHGSMQIGEERRPVAAGSLLYVPRGSVHAFRNGADEPATAYVIYLPPFDGEDRVPVDRLP